MLKLFIIDLLQKDVDLSKDDLLGDILQDLHSEVSVKACLISTFSLLFLSKILCY